MKLLVSVALCVAVAHVVASLIVLFVAVSSWNECLSDLQRKSSGTHTKKARSAGQTLFPISLAYKVDPDLAAKMRRLLFIQTISALVLVVSGVVVLLTAQLVLGRQM